MYVSGARDWVHTERATWSIGNSSESNKATGTKEEWMQAEKQKQSKTKTAVHYSK